MPVVGSSQDPFLSLSCLQKPIPDMESSEKAAPRPVSHWWIHRVWRHLRKDPALLGRHTPPILRLIKSGVKNRPCKARTALRRFLGFGPGQEIWNRFARSEHMQLQAPTAWHVAGQALAAPIAPIARLTAQIVCPFSKSMRHGKRGGSGERGPFQEACNLFPRLIDF